jgi:hypothetical protein
VHERSTRREKARMDQAEVGQRAGATDWVGGVLAQAGFTAAADAGDQGNDRDWGKRRRATGRWAIVGTWALRGSEVRERGLDANTWGCHDVWVADNGRRGSGSRASPVKIEKVFRNLFILCQATQNKD